MPAKFIKSASQLSECPESDFVDVGIVGRSNAGKSSLINALTKQKSLARVSQAPGKTTLLNFYEVDNKYMLVDMPGYGYASRGRSVSESWTPMIEGYLQSREQLKGVVLVMDVQRDWSEDEVNLVDWLAGYNLAVVVAFNKIDKLNQKELAARKKKLARIDERVVSVFTSAEKKLGIEELSKAIYTNIINLK